MKTVIEMARDAGATDLVSSLTHPKGPTTALRFGLDNGSLERFAALVRADEREACAKVCEDEDVASTDDGIGVQLCIAESIRARGQV